MNLPLFQNDPQLLCRPSIRDFGCYVRGLSQLCEKVAGTALTAKQTITQYDWLLENGKMLDERGRQAFVLYPEAVGKAAQFYLGVPQTFRAVLRRSVDGYDHSDFDTGEEPTHWLALGLIEGGKIPHFWEIDNDQHPLWDSLWPVRSKLQILSLRGFVI